MKSVDVLHKDLVDIERSETRSSSLGMVISNLEKMNERLERLEEKIARKDAVTETLTVHPSLDKFAIAEAIADQIFAGVTKEKACTFEPNGKPCDHCSMCNSRGF